MSRPIQVLGIGRNSWDRTMVLPALPGKNQKVQALNYASQTGGQVATTLMTLAKLGLDCKYIGVFGDDAAGRGVRASLQRFEIDLSDCRVLPGVPNQTAFVMVQAEGGLRSVVTYRDARLSLEANQLSQDSLDACQAVYVGGRHPDEIIPFARQAAKQHKRLVVDADRWQPDTLELLKLSSIVFCPEDFLDGPEAPFSDLPSLYESLNQDGRVEIAIQTRGSDGSETVSSQGLFHSPATDLRPVVDTTGAGDVFQGAFLYAHLTGMGDLKAQVKFASAAAAKSCLALGTENALPSLSDINTLI